MLIKKRTAVWISFAILLLIVFQLGAFFLESTFLQVDSKDIFSPSDSPRIAAPSDPILIHNESELLEFVTDEDLAGSGTESDPYVISDYEISEITNHTDNAAFYLGNTVSHITIQNIIIEHATVNQLHAWAMRIDNCSNVKIDSLIVRDIANEDHVDPGYIFAFTCVDSSNITLTNSLLENIYGDQIYYLDFYNCNSVSVTQIDCLHSLAVNSTTGISCYDSTDIQFSNVEFSNHTLIDPWHVVANSITPLFLSECDTVTIENCLFDSITSMNTNMIGRIAHSDYVTIQNNQWTNYNGDYFAFTITDTETCQISNNYFHDFQAMVEGYIFYCPDAVNYITFDSNIVNQIETSSGGMFYFDQSSENIITHNLLTGNIVSSQFSFARMGPNADDNQIYYNYVQNCSGTPAFDYGTDNEWTVFSYFEPLYLMTMVGNYWCTYNTDDEGSLHYFIETPFPIEGDANAEDTHPLHYFGVDFDNDGVNTYYELLYQLDPDDSDSDDDGISDYDEIDWWQGNHLENETEEETPETNTTTDDDGTNNKTTTPEASFWEKLGSDPGAIGIFGATAVLIVIAVQGFLKKKTL